MVTEGPAAARRILALNAGSSSLKFALLAVRGSELVHEVRGGFERLAGAGGARFVARGVDGNVLEERQWRSDEALGHARAVEVLLDFLDRSPDAGGICAAVHRVVHGGGSFVAPVRVDDDVLARLQTFVPLAPLHQPHNLRAMRLLRGFAPRLPQVACFDTAFHRTLPTVATRFAVPEELHAAGLRRYGFHGLSYEYVAGRLRELDPAAARGRAVVMHLGNGASMCALRGGRSIATTMSFSALDGLCMGTRCGALDPGAVLWLLRERGHDLAEVERLLYDRSGLLGVSGISGDMRALLASEDPRARLAIDLFVHRIAREIGAMTAELQGLDALVFTGGIGENAAAIRERVCRAAAWTGVELDPGANGAGAERISLATSGVAAWVVRTDEELMMARHALRVLEETRP